MFAADPKIAPLVHRQLEDYRRRFQRGERRALLLAIDLYLASFSVPKWMADGFFEAISQWLSYQVATLDEAFRVRRPIGKHLDKRRAREELRPLIMLELARRQQQYNAHMVRSTFDQVGADIGQSGGYVDKVYHEAASKPWRDILKHLRVRRA